MKKNYIGQVIAASLLIICFLVTLWLAPKDQSSSVGGTVIIPSATPVKNYGQDASSRNLHPTPVPIQNTISISPKLTNLSGVNSNRFLILSAKKSLFEGIRKSNIISCELDQCTFEGMYRNNVSKEELRSFMQEVQSEDFLEEIKRKDFVFNQ